MGTRRKTFEKKNKFHQGFSLIEMVLVMIMIIAISIIVFPMFFEIKDKNELFIASETVKESIELSQTLSENGTNDGRWGIKTQTGSVIIFQGNSFSTRNTSMDREIKISENISFSGSGEIVFEKGTSFLQEESSITLTNQEKKSKTININKKGTLNFE